MLLCLRTLATNLRVIQWTVLFMREILYTVPCNFYPATRGGKLVPRQAARFREDLANALE